MVSFIPSNEGIKHIDHTADLWLEARGKDFPSMISRMVQGIYGVMASSFEIEDELLDIDLQFRGPDLETAMVKFLSEVLFLFDAESWIFLEMKLGVEQRTEYVELHVSGKVSISSILEGQGGMEVKAVTFHGTAIDRSEELVIGKVLLDL